MRTEVCVLSDGRRVKFSLKKRQRDPYYLVMFAGPDGSRNERSTHEGNQKRAKDSAVAIIVQEFQPKVYYHDIPWDEAVEMLEKEMRAANLRPNSIITYKGVIQTLRDVFPKAHGPASITEAMAKQYKKARMDDGLSPTTVKGDLMELKTVFGKWWVEECGILEDNPFADVEPPKVDKIDPRIISPVERDAFMAWLSEHWDHWRLPLLFLEVKASIGCRIHELASLPTHAFRDGRLIFEAVLAKGRKTRRCKLPVALNDELRVVAGPNFIFEKFPEQLRDILLKKNRPHHAKCVKFPFDPGRLVNWLQDRLVEFRKAHPDISRFKLHNFRGTAMSRAKVAGVSYDEAAIAFGCHPETMRRHYVKLDETAISDAVMDRVQGSK